MNTIRQTISIKHQDAPSSNQISQIKRWFETAVPVPETINVNTQIGVHLEEVGEMLETFQEAALNQDTIEQMGFFRDVINHAQKRFKSQPPGFRLDLSTLDRKALLDSLCDQIVTAVGIAHMFEMDIEGGLQEVANSNDSKFNPDGTPIFNDHRKIMKGPDYFKPDLTNFV